MPTTNAQGTEARNTMALKLTIFTATEMSTASRWAAVVTERPANIARLNAGNCVEFAIARQARLRSHPDSGLDLKAAPLRIPLPANDNIQLNYRPRGT